MSYIPAEGANPEGIVVDRDGNVYLAQTGAGGIVKFAKQTEETK